MTAAATKTTGRPKKSGSERTAIEDSRIYRFLESKLPGFCVRGRLNVYMLAKEAGYSHQGVYHWFSKDRLPPAAADALVNISGGAFDMADMIPFFRTSIK